MSAFATPLNLIKFIAAWHVYAAAIEVDPNNLRVRDTSLERLMRGKQEIPRSRHIAHLPPAELLQVSSTGGSLLTNT